MRLLFCFFLVTSLYASEVLSLTHTYHVLQLDEQEILYAAVTGTIPIRKTEILPIQDEDDLAEIFFIAYFKEEEGDAERPITFFFPGGPGGSSADAVMCSFGPRRVLLAEEGKTPLPPYKIIDNPQTLLDLTDLVFVDPIGTGYSAISDEVILEELEELFSVEGDINVLARFIRSFISYFERWNSPKYLAGASYGATRCCGLAEALRSYDLSLHGLILLAPAIDYSTIIPQQNHYLPDCFSIPTYASTAWYYGRLWPEKSLEEVVEHAKRFALDRYAMAMFQPTRLSPAAWDALYKDLAHLIGLPVDTVRRYQGRLDETLYTTEFFGSERKIIGGLDTRYVGDLSTISRIHNFEDPSYRDMQGIHCAFNSYLQEELDTKKPFAPHIGFSLPALHLWDFFTFDSVYLPDLFQRLRRTLVANDQMQIFVGTGYFDCRTPFAATEYCFDHLQLPPSYQKNFQFHYYEAGHGFIFDLPSLKKLKEDLRSFYETWDHRSDGTSWESDRHSSPF